MFISPATPDDFEAVAMLVNAAYRGQSARKGWTHEAELLTGQRTDAQAIREDLAAKPGACILVLREAAATPILASVWLEPAGSEAWYLGMLTVSPGHQAGGIGRRMLAAAEAHAAKAGATLMRMSVIHLREPLIAWYERNGYRRTGETMPFPYDDPRVGQPLRADLHLIMLEKPIAS